MEQFQLLAGMMERMEAKMVTKDDMHEAIRQSETRTNVFIENTVSKKIEALFDGYKLTHEKQWELERRMEQLEQIVEELRSKIA